jgi:hypothetical protein
MKDNSSKNPTQKSIDRWEGEGGAILPGKGSVPRHDSVGRGGSHMPARRLSADEKQKIVEERRLKEIIAHPDKMIAVQVEDKTDKSGAPVVTVQHIGESAKDRKDRNA